MGDRTHFLWKACISTEECERQKKIAGKTCQREWYMDWRCVECCQGELCNYYATVSKQILLKQSVYKTYASGLRVKCPL
ncbi:unnamed protein product, partial [Trichobilharzia szidati]